jgi:hypothetical protein
MGSRPTVAEGDLVLRDEADREIWRGRPLGRRVKIALPVEGSSDVIALLDAGSGGTFRNLVRVGPDGTVRWEADLPRRDHDYYGYVAWNGDQLVATSFSSHTVTIDPDTGAIMRAEFTK